MPPAHGPQLNETTRQSGSRTAACWAHLLRYFVGRGVGHLAGPAEPRRRRREQDQELERLGIDRVEEMVQALDLGVVDQLELGVGLVDDPPVGQHAGAVDQPADRAELVADLGRSTARTAAWSRTSTER